METNIEGTAGQDLTTGNIRKQLWALAWPMMLSIFFYTLYNIVDAYWVSKVSDEAIAAVSISQITLFVMISLGFGITAGSGVVMAMNIGAKNIDGAERVLGQSFVLSALIGVLFTVVALAFRDPLLTASGATGAIFEPAKAYFDVFAGGSVLMFLLMSVMFAFNSQGDTGTLTKLFALSTVINLVLDPILIFGWLGFPTMGVAGAAAATLVSMAVFIAFAVRSLQDERMMLKFRFRNLTLEWQSVKQVLNIGFPAALTQVVFPIGLAVLTYLTAAAFEEPGAIAISIGFRIEFFAYLPGIGFGFAAMAMIGQNMGAGNLERARESLKVALKYAFAGALALGVLAAALSIPIIRIFTNDPTVTSYALWYMLTVSFSYGFVSVMLVEAPAFQAIGRSWPGFWIFLLRVGVIAVPMTYVLTQVLDLPIVGVWTAIVVSNVVSATVGYVWVNRALGSASVAGDLTPQQDNLVLTARGNVSAEALAVGAGA